MKNVVAPLGSSGVTSSDKVLQIESTALAKVGLGDGQ